MPSCSTAAALTQSAAASGSARSTPGVAVMRPFILSWARADTVNSKEAFVMILSIDIDWDLAAIDKRIKNIEMVVLMYKHKN